MNAHLFAPHRLNVISVQARISENTPRDLCGVETLTALAARTFDIQPHVIEGHRQPFGRTPWEEDLQASREVLGMAGERLADSPASSVSPTLTLATDCALALATLPAVVSQSRALRPPPWPVGLRRPNSARPG